MTTNPKGLQGFLRGCRSSRNLTRAGKTALVVGPLLVLINQTQLLSRLVQGETLPLIAAVRICLTLAVPFLVSLYSSAMADSAALLTALTCEPRRRFEREAS